MIDTGTTTGAGRRRRRDVRPEEQVRRLQGEYPKASPAQVRELYKSRLRELVLFDTDAIEFEVMTIVDEWLLRHVTDPAPKSTRSTPEQRQARKRDRDVLVTKIRAADEQRIETAIKVRLLEWMTPYGKKLRDCTGAECLRLSRRCGPFFGEIAKRLAPRDHVGNHLSERELEAIAMTHRLIGPDALR